MSAEVVVTITLSSGGRVLPDVAVTSVDLVNDVLVSVKVKKNWLLRLLNSVDDTKSALRAEAADPEVIRKSPSNFTVVVNFSVAFLV